MSKQEPYQAVTSYYNDFVSQLLHDYLHGNLRVRKQVAFAHEALPQSPSDLLVVGCGIGDVAFELRAIPSVRYVMGIDISDVAIAYGRKLFQTTNFDLHPMNIAEHAPERQFDCILLPDVYEHIPKPDRGRVHGNIRSALKPGGRVLLTVPSAMHQSQLIARGYGLQVVDETIGLDDLQQFARDLAGYISYYNEIAVWNAYDYVHAIIETRTQYVPAEDPRSRCVLKRNFPKQGPLRQRLHSLLSAVDRRRRRSHARRCLGDKIVANAIRKHMQ